MKNRLKVAVFVATMVTIVISSRRIADYLIDSYESGISYLAQAAVETKNFVIYK